MNAIDTKLNYFESKLEDIKTIEREFMMKKGQYDQEFQAWLKEQGLSEQFTILTLIKHFRRKSILEI